MSMSILWASWTLFWVHLIMKWSEDVIKIMLLSICNYKVHACFTLLCYWPWKGANTMCCLQWVYSARSCVHTAGTLVLVFFVYRRTTSTKTCGRLYLKIHSIALHTQKHTQSIFIASIHRIHPFNAPYFLPPLFCSISPPLIALSLSLPSNSLLFIPPISYRSDTIFISTLFSLSPVPLRLLPAVFVHCSPCTEMRCLLQGRHNHQSIYKSIMLSPAGTSVQRADMCFHRLTFHLPPILLHWILSFKFSPCFFVASVLVWNCTGTHTRIWLVWLCVCKRLTAPHFHCNCTSLPPIFISLMAQSYKALEIHLSGPTV